MNTKTKIEFPLFRAIKYSLDDLHRVLYVKCPCYRAWFKFKHARKLNFSFVLFGLGMATLGFFWEPAMAQSPSINFEQVFIETNSMRANENILSLDVNANLTKVAQNKAEDILKRGYFAHEDPDGNMVWPEVLKSGYNYEITGENLAKGYHDMSEMVKAWMDSPKHRENILNKDFRDIGIGIANGYFAPDNKTITVVVQIFGTQKINIDLSR